MVNLKELRKAVEKTFGERISTSKQCAMLEKTILKETNRSISSATLRRFFGLLPSSSKLSPYNTETLAIYCQFNSQESETLKPESLWEDIQKEARSYSKHYTNSIKKKSLSGYSSSIHRETIETKLNHFIDSDQSLTCITAPGGYGKSTLLCKWLESADNSITEKDIVLFTNALIFESTFQNDGHKTHFIDFSGNDSNSLQLINKNQLDKGKFIIIVDAIDELSLHIEKLKRFVLWFTDFLATCNQCEWLKIIFAVRDITYEKYMLPLFQQVKTAYDLLNQIPVPLFKQEEVLNVLRDTADQTSIDSLLCQITNPEIASLLQTPINLAIYLNNLPERNSELSTHNLYKHLLDTYIYQSFCAEEKIDIIEAVLEELITDNQNFTVSKNIVKKQYPIHLKQSGNYHLAYNELLSDGILYEFTERDYGQIASYYIAFKHVNFYYYLCAFYLIKANNGLNKDLLDSIVNNYENLEFKINVLEHLFCLAYENKKLEVVCHFFSLGDEIFSTINLSIVIGVCLRNQSDFQQKAVNALAKIPKAQKYLFELFVDVNNLVLGFNEQLKAYGQYKTDHEAQIYTTSLHLYHALLTLNKKEAEHYYSILDKLEFNKNTFPWPVGRKVAYSILYSEFCTNTMANYALDDLLKIRETAYANYHNGYRKEFLFDVSIVFALTLSCNYQLALDFGKRVIDSVKEIKHTDDFHYYAESFHYEVITLLLVYSRYKLGYDINIQEVEQLSSFAVTNASHYSSYQYIILVNFCASELYLQLGDEKKAKDYFKMAIRLSKHSKYDLLSAYAYFNNPFGNVKLKQHGERMLVDSGFELNST